MPSREHSAIAVLVIKRRGHTIIERRGSKVQRDTSLSFGDQLGTQERKTARRAIGFTPCFHSMTIELTKRSSAGTSVVTRAIWAGFRCLRDEFYPFVARGLRHSMEIRGRYGRAVACRWIVQRYPNTSALERMAICFSPR